jgi:hypothetical protein
MVGIAHKRGAERPYTTDLRVYGLPFFSRPLSNREFNRDWRDKVKAFIYRRDAVAFGLRCKREKGVGCCVYDRAGDRWTYNGNATGRLAKILDL